MKNRTFVVSVVATVAITLTPHQQLGLTGAEIVALARDIGVDCVTREESDTVSTEVEEVHVG